MGDDKPQLTRDRFDAVLFDLDGVLTDTARIHAACWKEMFDAFLQERAEAEGTAFQPFEIDPEYYLHVNGKPRYDGVRDFLASREIRLPEGTSDDPPTSNTVCGLGNRKFNMVSEAIASGGVEAYPGSVALVRQLRDGGIRTAVVSSSNSCEKVLAAAGIDHLFEARVDGIVSDARGLAGKPAPDAFLEAARELGVEPGRTVVVEDAISGVQAGRDGGFGLVIGVARKDDDKDLADQGAHFVVKDLSELVR